jgi:hypothetical protein
VTLLKNWNLNHSVTARDQIPYGMASLWVVIWNHSWEPLVSSFAKETTKWNEGKNEGRKVKRCTKTHKDTDNFLVIVGDGPG